MLDLSYREGDEVEAGAVLARLDSRLAELDVASAEAEVASAKGLLAQREAELDRARRDLDRVRSLDARGSANPRELDEAETRVSTSDALLTQARASVALGEAQLGRAREMLADKTVKAPFAGRVVRRMTEVGQWVSAGDAVMELVELDRLEAYLDVPEQLVPYLPERGSTITLTAPGSGAEAISGRFEAIVPVGDSLSRIFRLRLIVDRGESGLLPGMSARAMTPTGERMEGLTVHKDAILRDAAGAFVYAALPASGGDGRQAMPMRVSPLFAVGNRIVIREGSVAPGMALLVTGNERVYPTQALQVLNPDALRGGGSGAGGGRDGASSSSAAMGGS